MAIFKASIADIDIVAPLIAAFRAELRRLKGEDIPLDLQSALEEFAEYIDKKYPIFLHKEHSECLGYLVCRVEEPVVWVESLFVEAGARRQGIASALYLAAEELAHSYREHTLYNYVHPNNDAMIAFLAKRGYDVLNLIEIRKKRPAETTTEKIAVRNNIFNY